jgi:hypothetical protein
MRIAGLLVFFAGLTGSVSAQSAPPPSSSYARLPLAFERRGAPEHEEYIGHGNGCVVTLDRGSASIAALAMDGVSPPLLLEFEGARKTGGTAGQELATKLNYLSGNDATKWRLGIATYDSVTYRGIYPGVDVVYRGNQGQLEFDLKVKPGADIRKIRMHFGGADALAIDRDGALVVRLAEGKFRLPLPIVYQEAGDARKTVPTRYQLLAKNEVTFHLDAYDPERPLVIDPYIVYSALIGGGTYPTTPAAIALDANGDAYIAGVTAAEDFPTVNAAYPQARPNGTGFVSKIDPSGTNLLYSTYINGLGGGRLTSVAVDSTGAAWVTGWSTSTEFPLVNPYQSTFPDFSSAVVLKLSASGAPLFSTYFGSDVDGYGIAIDRNASAYLTGWGASYTPTVPTTPGAFLPSLASPEPLPAAFVTKFSADGNLVYSTFLGRMYASAIAVDSGGNAYVTGNAESNPPPNVPTGGAQPSIAGGSDAFVAKLNGDGSAMVYFTFLGGSQADSATAVAVDAAGSAYVAGSTSSGDFPVTQGAFQTQPGGGADGFVAKLNPSGSAFEYVTYLGGNRLENVAGLAIDAKGDAYVTGQTGSANFPTAAAIDSGLSGNSVSLYHTADAGASWAPFDITIPGTVTSVSPDLAAGVIVAATDAGIYRSTDSGQSWTQTSTLTNAYLSRSPANSSFIYEVDSPVSFNYSTDGGKTWLYLGFNLYAWADRIVADAVNPNVAYVYHDSYGEVLPIVNGYPRNTSYLPCVRTLVAASDGSLYADTCGYGSEVYKGAKVGQSWAAANVGLATRSYTANALAVSASNPLVLYKSIDNQVYVTTDGAASWALAGTAPATFEWLAVSATNPAFVYGATLAGSPPMYVSPDGGVTWNPAGDGLGVAAISQIVPDPANTSGAYGVASVIPVAFAAAINPTGSGLIYSTYLGSLGLLNGYGIAVNSAGDAFVAGIGTVTFPAPTAVETLTLYNGEAQIVRIAAATPACTVGVSPASQVVYGGPALLDYAVVSPSGCPWTASTDQPWASVPQGASGSGADLVYVGVSPNTTASARTATITVGGQSVSVTQAPSSCSYSLSATNASVPMGGATVQSTVSTAAGCPWAVTNNYTNAISIESGGTGTGDGTVTLTVSASAQHNSRTFYVAIGTSTLTITQAGDCTYSLNPASLTLSGSGASGTIAVTTQNECAWSESSSDTWLYTFQATGGVGSGTFSYDTGANDGPARNATITAAGLTIPVTQNPNPCAVTQDGTPSVSDTQQMVNEALGIMAAEHHLTNGSGVTVVDVQIVLNAVLPLSCSAF